MTGSEEQQVVEASGASRQVQRRVGKWTSGRKLAFCKMIAEGGSPTKAAEALGLSRQSAYYQRGIDAAFVAAWCEALEQQADLVEDSLFDNAIKSKNIAGQIFLAKNLRPDKWRDRHEVGVERRSVNIDLQGTLPPGAERALLQQALDRMPPQIEAGGESEE